MPEGQRPRDRMMVHPELYEYNHSLMYDIHDEIYIHWDGDKIVAIDLTPARRPRDYAEVMEREWGWDVTNCFRMPYVPWYDVPLGGGFFYDVIPAIHGTGRRRRTENLRRCTRHQRAVVDMGARRLGMKALIRKLYSWHTEDGRRCSRFIAQRIK